MPILSRMGIVAAALAISAMFGANAEAGSVQVEVFGYDEPWLYGPKLNQHRQYGVLQGGGNPVVVTLASLSASPGQKILIKYRSSCVAVYNEPPCTDANGDVNAIANHNVGPSGKYYPSYYIKQEPTYVGQLVVVFTDAKGKIVGAPYAGSDRFVKIIPEGATQVQLGVNSDTFAGNTGAWFLDVSAE